MRHNLRVACDGTAIKCVWKRVRFHSSMKRGHETKRKQDRKVSAGWLVNLGGGLQNLQKIQYPACMSTLLRGVDRSSGI